MKKKYIITNCNQQVSLTRIIKDGFESLVTVDVLVEVDDSPLSPVRKTVAVSSVLKQSSKLNDRLIRTFDIFNNMLYINLFF